MITLQFKLKRFEICWVLICKQAGRHEDMRRKSVCEENPESGIVSSVKQEAIFFFLRSDKLNKSNIGYHVKIQNPKLNL